MLIAYLLGARILFEAVSPTHAVTAFAVIVATAIAVLGQLHHAERRLPVVEPDALLMILIIGGALALLPVANPSRGLADHDRPSQFTSTP